MEGFILDVATAAERVARDRLTYDAWGQRLTREQYLDRERILRQTDHGRLSMHSWVLRVPNGVIVASCETFRLPLLPMGDVEVIASVFVDPPLRGARMASRLIAALVKNRREAGLDGMILFSEVGATIYERLGFALLPSPTRRWPAGAGGPRGNATLLGAGDLASALAFRNEARATQVDLRIMEHVFGWHAARSAFYGATLPRTLSDAIGARAGQVQVLWVPDFKCNVLRIMDATGPAGASLEEVIAPARVQARIMELDSVELWDDPVSARLPGGETLTRTDDLPMGLAFTPRGSLFLGPLSRSCWA
jgi:GNAT superfamily N-acetyltransferase